MSEDIFFKKIVIILFFPNRNSLFLQNYQNIRFTNLQYRSKTLNMIFEVSSQNQLVYQNVHFGRKYMMPKPIYQSVDASMRSPVTVTGWYQADDRCSGDRRGRAGGLQKIYLGVTCHRRVIQ